MKRSQQYYIFKFASERLKDKKYKIPILLIDDARKNLEVVSLSDSELIRTIFRVTGKGEYRTELEMLIGEKARLSKKKNKAEHRKIIKKLSQDIDNILFVRQLISVQFSNKSHYRDILKLGGFFVNGIRYVPFMASAGMIRRNSVLFVDESLKDTLDKIFNNGRDVSVPIVPAKFNAYYSLYSSSSFPVTFPRIAVIPDKTIKTIRKVDYSTYIGAGIDPIITEKEMELECNAFDGQGLCSPSMAKIWQSDLEIKYLPSNFIVRAPFLKGMLVTFDFHKYAQENSLRYFTDVYGNEQDIKKIDVIISESMLKLWNCYSSTEDYLWKCDNNSLGFGISSINPEKDKSHAKTSYQFLQVLLNLDDRDIEKLCEPTLKWLEKISGADAQMALLYSLGDNDFSEGWFDRLEHHVKALILDNRLSADSYIVDMLESSIAKKKNDAKMGRLMVNGNYSTMISDPFAQAAHIFGRDEYFLNEGEHYSNYWNMKNVSQVAGIRSPIVHSSEVNILNFIRNDGTEKWFKHIKSGIIFPAYGIGLDMAINGGSDNDGDIICTINSPEIIKGRVSGNPVIYDVKKPEKILITKDTEDVLHKTQLESFGTKVGFYTNVSSTMYSLLYNFEYGSPEKEALLQRLKYGRVLQGNAIDEAKGIKVDPFPEHWTKWKKVTDEMHDDEKRIVEFNNSILSERRPMFMRWLYPHYNKKFNKELKRFDFYCRIHWNVRFEDLLLSDFVTEEQQELIDRFYKRTYFINNESIMNKISRYVQSKIKHGRTKAKTGDFDYTLLTSKTFKVPSPVNLEKMKLLYKEYRSLKKNLLDPYGQPTEFGSVEQIADYIYKKALSTISSNATELCDTAIYLCYNVLGKQSKTFVWKVFGSQIIKNMMDRHPEKFVRIPRPSPTGGIEYLWEKYSIFALNIGREE